MVFKCNYGTRTPAEVRLVLHSAMFVWLTKNDWIYPLSQLCSEWLPADLFRFFRIKEPRWHEWLTDYFRMPEEEIEQLIALADAREAFLESQCLPTQPSLF